MWREERHLFCIENDSQLFEKKKTLRILPSVDDSKSATLSVRVLHTISQVSAKKIKESRSIVQLVKDRKGSFYKIVSKILTKT